MTSQFAIRHEIAELFGPLRCQRCAFHNTVCYIKSRSGHCIQCQSDSSECLFTRVVERSGGMHIFSWEELLDEKNSTRTLESYEDASRPNLNPSMRERSSVPQPVSRSRQETDLWISPLEARASPPRPHDPPHPSQTSFVQASTNAWLPLSAMPRRRYSSPVEEVSSDAIGRQAQHRMADTHGPRVPTHEPLYNQDQRSMDDSSIVTALLMPPPGPLPNVRDSLSDIDPRITSPRLGATRTWPLVKANSSVPTPFTKDDSEMSDRAQSSTASELSDFKSHDFVLETFNTTSRSMESRRGKRRGKLSESSASSASRLRSIGACWKCKLQKNQCSTEDPCGPCRKVLEAKKYCPPCFRGPLVDLVKQLFWNENPQPGSTNVPGFSNTLLPGAREFLNKVKRQDDEIIRTALRVYESNTESGMLEACGNVLHKMEISLNKSKHLREAEFFTICILDLVSRASEVTAAHLPESGHENSIQETAYQTANGYFRRSKTLEVLFGLIRPTSDYNPFQAISKATGGKPYDRLKDGTDLLVYVESCLFKVKPLLTCSLPNTKNLQMHLPLPHSQKQPTGPAAKEPSDRPTSEFGRKRGLSAESESQRYESQIGSRQRLPNRGPRAPDTDTVVEAQSSGKGQE